MSQPEIEAPVDVFTAARQLDDLWNSSARAVSPQKIEWMCRTWGSGRGRAAWTDIAVHTVVAEAFGLEMSSNWDGRDELIVYVPFEKFADVYRMIDRLTEGEEPTGWPWLDEEAEGREVEVAAQVLGMSASDIAANGDLMEALGIV